MSIHVGRLDRLATMLEGYRPEPGGLAFDLEDWSKTQIKRHGFLWLKKAQCGTAACAVGLACLSGEFASDGLSFTPDDDDGSVLPVCGEKVGWEAVRSFFRLTAKQAFYLFESGSYDTTTGPRAALAVAGRIRTMVKRSDASRRINKRSNQRTLPAVEKIKREALEPV